MQEQVKKGQWSMLFNCIEAHDPNCNSAPDIILDLLHFSRLGIVVLMPPTGLVM